MTDFLNFRHLGKIFSPTQSLQLLAFFVLIALFAPASSSAQVELFKCPEKEYPFTGSPQQTICGENPNFVCQTQIGAGTAFPKSSLWGSSISGDVCIIGAFEVDAPFTFQNATVKINSGVTITVKPSPNGFDPGSSLNIDNSRLFACAGLWKGITLGHLSTISTQNNSEIEDAETAIYATGLCALFIQQTTFNRNRVGIEMDTPSPNVFVPGPLMWTFSGNQFTCDAPLNGTVDEITTAGVKLKDSFLSTFQSGTNTFSDIQYGIYSEGASSFINCQNLIFQRIRRDGIYMDKGNINLRASHFLNTHEEGIHIVTANNVSISGNCVFTWDGNLPVFGSGLNPYYGIHIERFSVGSKSNISQTLFSATIVSNQQRVIGTWFEGADVAGGTSITMTQNNWQMYGGPAIGLLITGDFPSTSRIDIYNNDFDINGFLNAGAPVAISSLGNKYDFDIIGNRFYSSPPIVITSSPRGIDLDGSEGMNNQVSDNKWEDGIPLLSYVCGINAGYYPNTVYCSNIFVNSNQSFCFFGPNDLTVLTDNISYGSQIIFLFNQSWIGEQDQLGNEWSGVYQGTLLDLIVSPQAYCTGPDFAKFSEFLVHTAQSTAHYGSGFNPFHPFELFPDNTIEWWFEETGTPATGCINEIVDPGNGDTKLRRAVSDGSFGTEFSNNPSMIWQAQRSLFFALKRVPALESEYAAYSTFMTAKTGSNIDRFYQVFTGIDNARNGSTTLTNNAKNNHAAIDTILSLLNADDLAWQNAATTTEKENAQDAKKQHLSELMQLLSNATGFQTSYKQDLQTALVNVHQINNSVTPVGDWEIYEKTTNAIVISRLINGGITESQKDQLEEIASLCPKYGGMAVYRARGILPECAQSFDWDNYLDCRPAPTHLEAVEPRSTGNQSFQNTPKAFVQPNPATSSTTLIIPDDKQGTIEIVNPLGQVILSQKITSAQTTINLSAIPKGTYYLNIQYSDGKNESLRLVVTQ